MPNFHRAPLLCAVRGIGKTLDFAIEEARESRRPLYLLFVREQPVITSEDRKRKWRDDDEAREIFLYAKSNAEGAADLARLRGERFRGGYHCRFRRDRRRLAPAARGAPRAAGWSTSCAVTSSATFEPAAREYPPARVCLTPGRKSRRGRAQDFQTHVYLISCARTLALSRIPDG